MTMTTGLAQETIDHRSWPVIDGRAIARELKAGVAREVGSLNDQGIRAGIATVLIGTDYPARAYERRIGKMAAELGVAWHK